MGNPQKPTCPDCGVVYDFTKGEAKHLPTCHSPYPMAVEIESPEVDTEAEVRTFMGIMETSLRDAVDRMKAEGDDARRARILKVLAARESELQEVKEEMERLHGIISDLGEGEDRRRLEAVTFATARMELEVLQSKHHLDFLGQLAHEAVGSGPGVPSIDVQAAIRLQAFLAGTGVIGKAEDLQERLTIAEETIRRSEATRMGLHSKLREWEAAGKEARKELEAWSFVDTQPIRDKLRHVLLVLQKAEDGDMFPGHLQEELDRLDGVAE